MALGGVFEPHPNVRFGVIELSAFWVGVLALLFAHVQSPDFIMRWHWETNEWQRVV